MPKLCILGIYPNDLITKKSDHAPTDLCPLQIIRATAMGWKCLSDEKCKQSKYDLKYYKVIITYCCGKANVLY